MKSSKLGNVIALMMVAAAMSSCEKIMPSDYEGEESGAEHNVVLRVSQFETIPFSATTRSALGDVCTRLCFDIYDENKKKVKYINQKLGDEKFGEASLSLPEGDYYLVVLAHSSTKNPSDGLPDEANELLIKYTGSKGTFSGITGYGIKGNQSIILDIEPTDEYYDFYMVPRSENDTIRNVNIISRYNDGSSATYFSETTIESIPVRRNAVTVCRGSLFGGKSAASGTSSVSIVINDSWDSGIEFYF